MKQKLKNKSSKIINLHTLGIKLAPNESCDIQFLSFEQIKNFLISDEREEKLLEDLVFEIDDYSFSGNEMKKVYSITKKGNDFVSWKNLFIENLSPFEEVACNKLFETCCQENIPILGIKQLLSKLPIILDDGYTTNTVETTTNLMQTPRQYCLVHNDDEAETPLETTKWTEAGKKKQGWFQKKNYCVYKSPEHLKININTKKDTKYYSFRSYFDYGYSLLPYTGLSFDIWGEQGVVLKIVAKRRNKSLDTWTQNINLISGWQNCFIDLTDFIKTDLKYIEFRFFKTNNLDEVQLLLDTPSLHSGIINTVYKKHGRLETYTKQTISPVKEIFVNIMHTCENKEQCQVSCFVSLDNGEHWQKIENTNYEQWINIKNTSPWNTKKAIKFAIEINGDSTNTAFIRGYYLMYRTGED